MTNEETLMDEDTQRADDIQREDEAPLIDVRLFAAAAAVVGVDRVEVPGRTVADVLARLTERTDPEGARVIARSSLLVNAVACRETDRALASGDRVDVLPPFAGG